jgi:hypothetical protein
MVDGGYKSAKGCERKRADSPNKEQAVALAQRRAEGRFVPLYNRESRIENSAFGAAIFWRGDVSG